MVATKCKFSFSSIAPNFSQQRPINIQIEQMRKANEQPFSRIGLGSPALYVDINSTQ